MKKHKSTKFLVGALNKCSVFKPTKVVCMECVVSEKPRGDLGATSILEQRHVLFPKVEKGILVLCILEQVGFKLLQVSTVTVILIGKT